jgi:cytoskeletal protein CcmA (bactofilin family)
MFKKGKTMARNFDNNPEMVINRIVEGTNIQGDITSESNIRIDGKFTGSIAPKGRLVVGPTGNVDGSVTCTDCEVEGRVKGKIQVKQMLSLRATAKLDGEIFTDKLSIEPGASFQGTCNMGAKIKDMNSTDDRRETIHEEKTA